jgi:hypothetical protein
MKKYTNKILITGVSILILLCIGFFANIFYKLTQGVTENEETIEDPMVMHSITDEEGNVKIEAQYNGKTMVIDPNNGTYRQEVKDEITSSFSDTAQE